MCFWPYLPPGGSCFNVELNHDYYLDGIVALLDTVEKFRHFKG